MKLVLMIARMAKGKNKPNNNIEINQVIILNHSSLKTIILFFSSQLLPYPKSFSPATVK